MRPREFFIPAKLAADSPQLNLKPPHSNARIARREFLENRPRIVLRTIVGDDDFVRHGERINGSANRFDQFAEVALLRCSRG
jgi:hypothetical protein